MRYRGRRDGGVVKMHLLEFAENSADLRHFAVLHQQMLIPYTQIAIPFLSVDHTPSWTPDNDHPHIAYFDDIAMLKIFGKSFPATAAYARITMLGPGSIVTFRFTLPQFDGQILLFQTHTPETPMRQRVRFRWYATPSVPRILVGYVVGSWISQWQRDIAIWERKIYRSRPMLVPEDGPMLKLRRWYKQFFPQQTAAPEQRLANVQSIDPNGG
jgi:hypothetical protein